MMTTEMAPVLFEVHLVWFLCDEGACLETFTDRTGWVMTSSDVFAFPHTTSTKKQFKILYLEPHTFDKISQICIIIFRIFYAQTHTHTCLGFVQI